MSTRKRRPGVHALTVAAIALCAVPALTIEPSSALRERQLRPWTATVWIGGVHQCGGSLIDRRWVLTARHCVADLCEATDFSFAKIHMGYLQEKLKPFTIREVVCPADAFEMPGLWSQDIALVRIDKVFGRDHRRPVVPPSSSTAGGTQDPRLVAVGWAGPNSSTRRSAYKIELVPLTNQECEQLLEDSEDCPNPPNLGATQFCAWSAPPQPTTFYGLHKGDSGGPLVRVHKTRRRPEVVGVASAACSGSGLAVFEDASRYREWIVEKVCAHYAEKWGAASEARCRQRLQGSMATARATTAPVSQAGGSSRSVAGHRGGPQD